MKDWKYLVVPALFLFGVTLTANAQKPTKSYPSADFKVEFYEVEGSEDEYIIEFIGLVPENSILYGVEMNCEIGPIPADITFHEGDFELVGELSTGESIKKKHDDIFMCDITYFEGEAHFFQRVKIADPAQTELHGKLSYQLCYETLCKSFDYNF